MLLKDEPNAGKRKVRVMMKTEAIRLHDRPGDGLAERNSLRRRPIRRWSPGILSATVAVGLAMSLAVVNAPAAQADDCNDTKWTWPWCHISKPSIPRIDTSGPRPDLTPKNSAWCRDSYIPADNAGYFYWALTQNQKYKITLWPDYFSRYYQLMQWDGTAWRWVPQNKNYPDVIIGQRVNCDA